MPWAAPTQDSPEFVGSTLRRIGAAHQRQGFPEAWYRSSGRALLDAAHEIHKGDWGSLLSSHGIAYYTWLSASLVSGSARARSGGGHHEPPRSGTGETSTRAGPVSSLGDVFAELRARHFPGDERALAAICTRGALRTGADLRNPQAAAPDGDLRFWAQIPPGMEVDVMRSGKLTADTRGALRRARLDLGGSSGAVLFDCGFRRLEMDARNLSAAFPSALDGIPAAGFHTYGESWLGHVNQTLTGVVFGRPTAP
ncbi:FIST C-terminal domain-containing protein [Streptomyces sp. NPDC093089]|uniref:FIST C-terminal domain-containing protein n=1 Tax=Streptomyces sp. NPDC093089 TaxID=3366024 RepID=UPI003805C912